MRRGRDNRGKGNEEEQASRAMSKVLRHGAIEEGLSMETSGYVPLEEVMQYLRKRGIKNVSEQLIRSVVDNNDKKRFEIEDREGDLFIRATQGHSIKMVNTEDLLTKITDPSLYPIVVHGTFSKFWPSIRAEGLKRMTRNHIHFAPGMPKE